MRSLLVVGIPNSGKSTFIAALRHLLLADEVPTDLCLVGLSAHEAHLNKLEKEWLDCRRIERTKPATEGWVELHVADRKTGADTKLLIPDLRGEVFEQPACISQCQSDLFDALAQSDGILLFTNADRADDAMLIDELADILDSELAQSEDATLGDAQSSGTAGVVQAAHADDGHDDATDESVQAIEQQTANRFQPEHMPEEVKIVEFLQIANRRPLRARCRKIAVIVSAWDLVMKDKEMTPDKWLSTRRPMLGQFLETNKDIWNSRVYGVSAQDGRLPEDKEALEKIIRPSERIHIVGHGADAHDITAPIGWMIHFSGGSDAVEG
ncbi:TRAFAC clade GTPase domain-containing protein [Paraburkholderia adhaesiva]|uniref:TRAFAC clade GTPase domain-containing protein n=1 Tax=Paraburkholderia adhaesiva TaxID=2883244 RepID=UPI001F22A760|nr:hypothetical protein [Paraburkholderia adhaesiva]